MAKRSSCTDRGGTLAPDLQVVAFVKGTRRQPQCGFSHRVLSILNEVMRRLALAAWSRAREGGGRECMETPFDPITR